MGELSIAQKYKHEAVQSVCERSNPPSRMNDFSYTFYTIHQWVESAILAGRNQKHFWSWRYFASGQNSLEVRGCLN